MKRNETFVRRRWKQNDFYHRHSRSGPVSAKTPAGNESEYCSSVIELLDRIAVLRT